jgi:hypothetical protein
VRLPAAVLLAILAFATPAHAAFDEYEVESAEASLSSYEAGAHADFTTSFKVKAELGDGDIAQTRDVRIALPPGLLGDPTAFPKCTMAQMVGSAAPGHCPQDSQVGITLLELEDRSGLLRQPVYNMTNPGGDVVARFGFMASVFYPATINVKIRSGSDYGATASVEGAAGLVGLLGATTTIWGVPADPVHDLDRITPFEGETNSGPPEGRASTLPPVPFLSNPTRCGVPLEVAISADSYQLPDLVSTKRAVMPSLGGCSKLTFHPSLSALPTTSAAAEPTGLDATLDVPQDETPGGRATPHLRDARVALPEGMTLSPGAADGLATCNAEEAGYRSAGPARCPDAAKLGSVEMDVVGLERVVHGALYQRNPEPGHLFRVWLTADELGVHVALPGTIELDPVTGRVSTSFLEDPQVPLRELRMHIFGGARGPLATPSSCGTYLTRFELTPWSDTPAAAGNAPMRIDEDCAGGGLDPALSAGSLDSAAGAFSPFVFDLTRGAKDQNISQFMVNLPSGLLAKLAGVGLCQGSLADSGNCPPSSRIGSVNVAAGQGSSPLWIPQPGKQPTAVYLGGPYDGAPYSVIADVPAQAGPFDLGAVVVRSALRVDPETARVSVDTPPLPQILQGVPISYRQIGITVDRNHFTLNPTNCEPEQVTADVTGIHGLVAHPSVRYQVANCRALPYSPKLSFRMKGGNKRTQHPSLSATLVQAPRQANTARVTTILPASEFIDQAHISDPCTRPQFKAGSCPPGSVLGRAEAISPLLDQPLKGNVYFRSNGGARELPDIVADLHGSIHIVLVGYVDAVKQRGTEESRIRTVFAHVPDAPVRKFKLRLFGGKRGLLVNSVNICRTTPTVQVKFKGQNGLSRRSRRSLNPSCRKRKSR